MSPDILGPNFYYYHVVEAAMDHASSNSIAADGLNNQIYKGKKQWLQMRACFCNVHVLENAFYANHFWAQTGNLIMYNLIQAVIIYQSWKKNLLTIFFGLKNYYPL